MSSKTKRVPKPLKRARKSKLLKLKPDDDLVWDEVCQQLLSYFRSGSEAPAAKIALKKLVEAGCDEKAILQNLYAFCGGDPEQMKLLRESYDFKGQRKRVLATAEQLRQVISNIQSTEKLLKDLGIICHFTPDISSLEKYSEFLHRFGRVAFRLLASKRIGGRDQHLVYLCKMVDRYTGRQHYNEIAELVNATRQLYDQHTEEIATAEMIRQHVRRYRGFLGLPMLDLDSEIELSEIQQAKP